MRMPVDAFELTRGFSGMGSIVICVISIVSDCPFMNLFYFRVRFPNYDDLPYI